MKITAKILKSALSIFLSCMFLVGSIHATDSTGGSAADNAMNSPFMRMCEFCDYK